MGFNLELLNWFSNVINFLIFAYISINLINTKCFNISQMSLSLIGLLAYIFMQIISMVVKQNLGKRVK